MNLKVGDHVLVVTYPKCSRNRKLLSDKVHTVVEVLDQKAYPGGVTIAPAVDLFTHWNEDSLIRVRS